jgi:imidazole glycerol phosphate synthase subunit HisF
MDAVRAHGAGADAVAVATVLHYDRYEVSDFKEALRDNGVEVRK